MPDARHQSTNYDELERILDIVEPLLFSLAGEQALVGASVERWRWDEPAVTLTWKDRRPGNINRNIRLIVEGEPPNYRVLAEANAWIDEDLPDTGGRQRRWHHEVFDKHLSAATMEDEASYVRAVAEPLLQDAYDNVSKWSSRDLEFTHRLVA